MDFSKTNNKVDLHIHSYISDGEWSGQQIVDNIDKEGIKMFAVSDHDDVGCIPELASLVKNRKDLTYIKAVEISTQYKGKEIHLLTYHIDENHEELLEILAMNRHTRDAYNENLILYLSSRYAQISLEDYTNYDYNPYQGGWLTFCYLKDRKVIENLKDYFKVIEGFNYDKVFIEPETLLQRINAAGFTPVLAHPPAYAEGDLWAIEDLDYFRELGIKGIECYTQYLKDQNNATYYVDYCNKHNLVITGGSDCHGGFAGRRLGFPSVTESMIRL